MDRIAIIGCGGFGKTFVANQLAEVFNLPVTHLDGVYAPGCSSGDFCWRRCVLRVGRWWCAGRGRSVSVCSGRVVGGEHTGEQ